MARMLRRGLRLRMCAYVCNRWKPHTEARYTLFLVTVFASSYRSAWVAARAGATGKVGRFSMHEDPGDRFNATFTPAAVQPIIAALKRAYLTACEFHDPARGSNETTFGFNLYQFAVHELCNEAGPKKSRLRVISAGPVFRLGIGDFELACHRVGRSAKQDIRSALPNNDGAAITMVEQLWLPGMEEIFNLPKARKVVIAHLGNPEDGMGAVYLCIAGHADGERITSWAYTHPIWNADDEDVVETPAAPPPPKPADEVIAPPAVRKKPRKDRKNSPKDASEEET